MSFLESVIEKTRQVEGALSDLGATGRGMHEKVTSIQGVLPVSLVGRLRYIASVRNKLMHEHGYRFDEDEAAFLQKCDGAIVALHGITPPTHFIPKTGRASHRPRKPPASGRRRSSRRVILPLGMLVVILLLVGLGRWNHHVGHGNAPNVPIVTPTPTFAAAKPPKPLTPITPPPKIAPPPILPTPADMPGVVQGRWVGKMMETSTSWIRLSGPSTHEVDLRIAEDGRQVFFKVDDGPAKPWTSSRAGHRIQWGGTLDGRRFSWEVKMSQDGKSADATELVEFVSGPLKGGTLKGTGKLRKER